MIAAVVVSHPQKMPLIRLHPRTSAFLYGLLAGTLNAGIITYMVSDLDAQKRLDKLASQQQEPKDLTKK